MADDLLRGGVLPELVVVLLLMVGGQSVGRGGGEFHLRICVLLRLHFVPWD